MKLQAQKIESSSEGFDTADFGMETNDPAVIQILLEGIYPSPYVWPREIIANWADAGGGGSLLLPDRFNPNWVIEDHGPGMTDEFMAKKYTMIFHSTKRDSDEKTGGFGHGRLSPLAYVETFSVRSRYLDQETGVIMEGNYIVFKNEVRVPRIARVSLAPSEVQQTGVTVTIPIADKDIPTIIERTKFYASYSPTPPEGFEKLNYIFANKTGAVRPTVNNRGEMPGIRLVLAGIPYPVPTEARLPMADFDLFFEGGELQPTLSREGINADNEVLDLIKARYAAFIEEYREHITTELNKKKSLFEKFTGYLKIAEALPYGLRSIIFPSSYAQSFSTLPVDTIFSTLKGNFNLHQISSDVDRYSYEGLDVETKTLKSLTGLRIKDLTGTGVAQRKDGQNFKSHDILEFKSLMSRKYSSRIVDKPQVVIFGIKAPYLTGQIKLMKEAIAAKLTELRNAGTLGNFGTAMLLQYEDEADVKRLSSLFAPDDQPIIITDSSKRAASQQYISVTTASDQSYSRTHPVKLSDLNKAGRAFIIRKPDWRAHDIHNKIMDTLRRMPLFKNTILTVITEGDAKLLDSGYRLAEDEIHNFIRKKWGYPLDLTTINNQMGNASSIKNQITNHILNYRTGPNSDQKLRPRLSDVIAEKETLKKDAVLQAAIKLEASVEVVETLQRIYGFAVAVKNLNDYNFFTKAPQGGSRPLPIVADEALAALEAFETRFPMLKMIGNNHQRSYGFNAVETETIIDYIETVNRNCTNVQDN